MLVRRHSILLSMTARGTLELMHGGHRVRLVMHGTVAQRAEHGLSGRGRKAHDQT